jgi:dephospho-CoA kinase
LAAPTTGETSPTSEPLQLVIAAGAVADADATVDNGSAEQIDALWAEPVVPFEANLCMGRRAPRRQYAVLADPDPTWSRQTNCLMARLRFSVGGQIIRVDHIGSTSVQGLPAKQLIDSQVVVTDLAVAARVAASARCAGFVHVPGQWFGTDRHGIDHPEEVVVDADPGRPVNINIRSTAAPIWRETLLFRDWLRSHPDVRDAYAAMKRELVQRRGQDVNDSK